MIMCYSIKLKRSFCILDLGNVLASTPNAKTVNGKAESSDSGAESEVEAAQEDPKRPEPCDSGNLWAMG